MKEISVIIDGKKIKVPEGTTVLRAAADNGIEIPNLCFDGRVELYGACGLCVVEAEGIPKLLRACSTKLNDGMIIHTESERILRARKTALELLLSDHDGDCKAPCTLACPANTDCQGYVGLIANGEYKEAVKLIKDKIPLPSSIGRICPHPCEKKCRRQFVDEPISIAGLKAFASDMDMASNDKYVPYVEPDTGKRVAIVGGGPGGLTAAYFLRRLGHSVNVFDMMPKMGGMLRYGIPEYRLPKKLLDREISQIEALGVNLKNNVKLGRDIELEELRHDFDAVVVAAGAWKSSSMRIPGEELNGVFGGIDFLREVSLGNAPVIGKTVAVIGGGNTAMDACRTAVRLGAEKVYVIYRRTRNEMPAEELEITEATEEGVEFKFLNNPIEFIGENGKLKAVNLQKMKLGEPDSGGRRRPEPIVGDTEMLYLDSAVMAIGQHPDLSGLDGLNTTKRNTIFADEGTFRTSLDGVFAVGDITNKGADIAISAIGEAQKAAVVIDRFLNGESVKYKKPFRVERELPSDYFARFEKAKRQTADVLPALERKNSFKEVSKGFTEEQAKAEAMRCLECGCHDFFDCKLIKYANKYNVKPEKFNGTKHSRNNENKSSLIIRNVDKCILCGLCVRVCDEAMGNTVLGLIGRGFDTVVSPEFGLPLEKTDCSFCGQCAVVCPTGAIIEKQPCVKNLTVKEEIVNSVCNLCSALCKTEIHKIGNTVIRIKPSGENGLLCKAGKFSVFALNDLKAQALTNQSKMLHEVKKVVSEADRSNISVVLGPSVTAEEIKSAFNITDNVFAELNPSAAAFRAFEKYGVKSVEDMPYKDVCILVKSTFGNVKKGTLISIDFKQNAEADISIVCAPFVSDSGTYIDTDGVKHLNCAVNSALPTALSVMKALIIKNFDEKSEDVHESSAIHKEIIRKGGAYRQNLSNSFVKTFTDIY